MSRRCSSCNAVVESEMRVCPNCGRLLASIGDRHEYQPDNSRRAVPASAPQKASGHTPGRRAEKPKQKAPVRAKQGSKSTKTINRKKKPAPPQELPRSTERSKAPEEQESRAMPFRAKLIKRTAITVIIAAAVYFALFGLQVLRIRNSGYKFDTAMTLSASTYGEAFDKSVTDGSWSYNPFTFTMTYRGVHDGKDIAVKFSAGFDLDVKSITVGEEEKTSKEQINIYLMGLYI